MTDLPRIEPPSDVRQAAFATRQIYIAFISAGFSRKESFELTRDVFKGGRSS